MIDRDRAADLGISMQEIGRNLAVFLGGNYVNRFSLDGRSYKVIPQVDQQFRLDAGQLGSYYLRTASGEQVPLGSLVHLDTSVEPSKRTQFQQLNSLTVQGLMTPGVTLGDAMAYLEGEARELFPRGYTWDYTGSSRQYAQQGSALIATFFMSLLVIYLVLAAQFESWRDPLIILVSVPMDARLRVGQHLHPGWTHHPDRPDRQERHPDRRVREPAADTRRAFQARGGRAGLGDPPAADPDDDRRDG